MFYVIFRFIETSIKRHNYAFDEMCQKLLDILIYFQRIPANSAHFITFFFPAFQITFLKNKLNNLLFKNV